MREISCWITLYYCLLFFLCSLFKRLWVIYFHLTHSHGLIHFKRLQEGSGGCSSGYVISLELARTGLSRPEPHQISDITSDKQQETQINKYFSSCFTMWGLSSSVSSIAFTTKVKCFGEIEASTPEAFSGETSSESLICHSLCWAHHGLYENDRFLPGPLFCSCEVAWAQGNQPCPWNLRYFLILKAQKW